MLHNFVRRSFNACYIGYIR